jgi:hypothetical protein
MFIINFYNPEMEYCEVFLCLAVSATLQTIEELIGKIHLQKIKRKKPAYLYKLGHNQ